jgi:hypothetical protein
MSDIPNGLNVAIAKLEAVWKHSNKYSAESACEHCEGIVRHEVWCVTQNANVIYAFGASVDPAIMIEADHIILHGMGVAWNAYERKCIS